MAAYTCGCQVVAPYGFWLPCPTHNAAEDLLTALRLARDFALESDRARNTPGWEKVRSVVDAALARAKGR